MAGERDWELWVIVDPQVMAARKVSLSLVINAFKNNLRDLLGGLLRAAEGDIMLRGIGLAPDVKSIERIALRSKPMGGQLLVKDVARVARRL